MNLPLITLTVQYERDVVAARQRARHVAALLGMDAQDQTRVATAVSEIARNAFAYAKGGRVELAVEGKTRPQVLVARISDSGGGIPDLETILAGRYRSATGMGVGILGSKRLMDSFEVETSERGTTVWLRKLLPARAPMVTPELVKKLTGELAAQRPQDALAEVQQQNQELLATLEELRKRQEELRVANHELEDTNRGVVALYAELEERADHLRRADEVKTRFLSNMTHEFRTPVNSVLALTGLLLERTDGELNAEQEKQIGYIRKGAQDLSELVNDLLDLAKVEAGKIVVRPSEFEVRDLIGALRGMLRPLLVSQSVALVFEEPEGVPTLETDESKVSQILRNLISNALKFTERGEVRVGVRLDEGGERVVFTVADTGIGIAPEDQERIFHEFGQLENPVQRRVRGTGLGLPLSRKLAELLGGELSVESALGAGSRFTVALPVVYKGAPVGPGAEPEPALEVPSGMIPVLAVEDRAEDRLVYERLLRGSPFHLVQAANLRQARQVLRQTSPRVILLDLLLGTQDAWKFLTELKGENRTAEIPVLIVTTIEDREKAFALGADGYGVKPLERAWLLGELNRLIHRRTALIIDDDEASRYTLHQMIRRAGWEAIEARNGQEGLDIARETKIRAVFLDLTMPGMGGEEVLRSLRAEPGWRTLPVFISSSIELGGEVQSRLEGMGARLLPKGLIGSAGIAAALSGLERAGVSAAREEGVRAEGLDA